MKPIKRTIILCWTMLIVCFIIKLFGWNWFEIVCTNEHFVRLCDIIDNNKFLYYFIGIILYLSSSSFIIFSCSMIPHPSNRELCIIITCFSFVWATQFISHIVKCVVEVVAIISVPIILNVLRYKECGAINVIKKKWYYGIIGCVAIFGFQAISAITRNIGIRFVDDSTLTSIIMMIDYYIMIALYYLYIRMRKEIDNG